MKICTKCNTELENNNFTRDKTKKDGFYSSCKNCYRKKYGTRIIGTFESPVKTHGMSETRFYKIYRAIIDRCYYKSNCAYKNYGGRGIKCEWKTFEEFKSDMYESYLKHCEEFGEKETTIDRINNDGNYCKENCRWATNKEQANNKRNVKKFEINGKYYSMPELGDLYGLNVEVIRTRLFKYGYSLQEALLIKKYQKHYKEVNGLLELETQIKNGNNIDISNYIG